MKWMTLLCAAGVLASGLAVAEDANSPIDRGRYLVAVGGCNDSHTPGFAESNGNVPEVDQLLGSDIGYSGPWGVSYAGNLRLAAAMMSPEQWRARAKGGGLPPMPWPSLRAMTDADLDAVHAYLLHLGPAGENSPAPLPPGEAIDTRHFVFVPQAPDKDAKR